MKKLTLNEFITRAHETHGDTYSYTKTYYTNKRTKVVITCKLHGDFNQYTQHHINGSGCPTCGGYKKPTTDEFIIKAIGKHGNKYKYNKVNYITSTQKIIIFCPKHGDFLQTPNDHLCGYGCAKCSTGGFRSDKPAEVYLYAIDNTYLGFGITGEPKARHRDHRRNLAGREFKLLSTHEFNNGVDAENIEKELYKLPFLGLDVVGFRRECVSLDLLDEVKTILSHHF